jgi:hypothetical protein
MDEIRGQPMEKMRTKKMTTNDESLAKTRSRALKIKPSMGYEFSPFAHTFSKESLL